MKNVLMNELRLYASSLNILIVEDDNQLNENLVDLMETFFKHVDSAKNGIEALKLYKTRKYDIVLTDLNMPRMDGVQLAKELRIINKEQCILVLSAFIDDFVIELIDIGIQGLILKPYEIDKFLNVISKNCENIVIKKEFKRSKFKSLNDHKPIKHVNTFGIENLIEKTIKADLVAEKQNIKDITSFNKSLVSWEIIEEDIKDYNFDMAEIIDQIMLHGIDKENLMNLSNIFRKYYSSLTLLDNLDKFSSIFEDIAEYFYNLDLNQIPKEKLKDFDTYLYIYDDLINFFDVVFIKKECRDINYLTDSLKSSVEQMKYSLNGVDIEEEEFELF